MSKIAFIFPGQGAQTTGMGQDFYQETETGREMFEKASEILGFSMTDLCFDPAQTDRLNITEYTQPAMVTASLAMMRVFMERTGICPDVAAGLSLGEYPAMAAASKNCVISIMFHLLSMIMSELQKIWMRMEFTLDKVIWKPMT